jgi:hypothetical protein
MTKIGIYTLANDAVYNQLVALLNSIEVNIGVHIPVCIIPYNEKFDLVKKEITSRANVTIFENSESIQRWEKFAHEIWAAHPGAKSSKLSRNWWSNGHLQRKMCAFDGEFDKFVFCDADSLVMKPFDDIFEKLNTYAFVFDDWIHTKNRDKVPLNIPFLEHKKLFLEENIRPKLHCSDFFGSIRGLFPAEKLELYKKLLLEETEVNWLTAWWDDAHLFNYLTFKSNLSLFNFTLSDNGEDRTGNCAIADPFVSINNVLYNKEGLKPIHRLHYMNYPAADFARLCAGEDVDIRYREEFLYYRFLKQPDSKPQTFHSPSLSTKIYRLCQKATNKVKLLVS